MANYFLDTEFIEGFHKPLFGKRRHFIDLISIGIVSDDNRKYYAISKEFDERKANPWVKENVISKLSCKIDEYPGGYYDSVAHPFEMTYTGMAAVKKAGKSIADIRREIVSFMRGGIDDCGAAAYWYVPENTKVFAYYADYDWVLFCSIFGTMQQLPGNMPMYAADIKQMMDERGLTKEWKRLNLPDPIEEHNALVDASWNKKLYDLIITQPILS